MMNEKNTNIVFIDDTTINCFLTKKEFDNLNFLTPWTIIFKNKSYFINTKNIKWISRLNETKKELKS